MKGDFRRNRLCDRRNGYSYKKAESKSGNTQKSKRKTARTLQWSEY